MPTVDSILRAWEHQKKERQEEAPPPKEERAYNAATQAAAQLLASIVETASKVAEQYQQIMQPRLEFYEGQTQGAGVQAGESQGKTCGPYNPICTLKKQREQLANKRLWPGVVVYDPIQNRERVVHPPFDPRGNEQRVLEWWRKRLQREYKQQQKWGLPGAILSAAMEPRLPEEVTEKIGEVPVAGPLLEPSAQALSTPLWLLLLLTTPSAAGSLTGSGLAGLAENLAYVAMTHPEALERTLESPLWRVLIPSEQRRQFIESLGYQTEDEKAHREKP